MAAIPISNLPVAIAVNGVDEIPLVQAGTTVRATINQISQNIDLTALIFYLTNLPTTLPAVPGKLWNNGGVICIS